MICLLVLCTGSEAINSGVARYKETCHLLYKTQKKQTVDTDQSGEDGGRLADSHDQVLVQDFVLRRLCPRQLQAEVQEPGEVRALREQVGESHRRPHHLQQ